MSTIGGRQKDDGQLPEAVEIIGLEKRKGLSKYYAYVVQVLLKDGSLHMVFRRYREFHDLNQKLEERFPVDAGYFNYGERKLPEMPKKIYLGRSSVRNVADERQPYLNYYLQHLQTLPNNIRYDSIVLSFLRQNSKDTEATEKRVAAGLDSPPQQLSPPISSKGKPLRTLRNTTSGLTSSGSNSSRPPPSRPPPPGGSGPVRPTGPPPPRPTKKPTAPVPQRPSKPTLPPSWSKPSVAAKNPNMPAKPVQQQRGAGGRPPAPFSAVASVKLGLKPRVNSYILDVEDDKDGESDEWDEDEAKGKITFYYKGMAREIEVDSDFIEKPCFKTIKLAIEDAMPYGEVTLNFKDKHGDLIQITDQNDMKLLTKYSALKKVVKDPLQAKWSLYITKRGDLAAYNTHPYEKK